MLWNGQFGATSDNIGTETNWTPGTPKETNNLGFEGIETQAIAGLGVHRMNIDKKFCEDFNYAPIIFEAFQTVNNKRKPIYHTNVMMCIAETFAIICIDSIDDKAEQKMVLFHLKESGKETIFITEEQVNNFAGIGYNFRDLKG